MSQYQTETLKFCWVTYRRAVAILKIQ